MLYVYGYSYCFSSVGIKDSEYKISDLLIEHFPMHMKVLVILFKFSVLMTADFRITCGSLVRTTINILEALVLNPGYAMNY